LAPRPLPFFAKFGARANIERERGHYRDYADLYIPFHLRPNLDNSRCLPGFDRGLLVGNFVERARPLWSAVEDGEASAAIHGLFDVTLAGWWAQGFFPDVGRKKGAVACALTDKIFDHRKVKEQHLEVAGKLGLTLHPKELWERLLGLSQCYYQAPMHGDLHPDNIFVRGSDAILIDLGSAQQGPLSGDPACLETFLAFETRPGEEGSEFDQWRNDIDKLFSPEAFRQIPPPLDGPSVWAARWNAARKVRVLAMPTHACDTEYRAAVAVYLLRRGTFDADNTVAAELDGLRRAYAMVAAEHLIFDIEKATA
jgi:hypothetical protein